MPLLQILAEGQVDETDSLDAIANATGILASTQGCFIIANRCSPTKEQSASVIGFIPDARNQNGHPHALQPNPTDWKIRWPSLAEELKFARLRVVIWQR